MALQNSSTRSPIDYAIVYTKDGVEFSRQKNFSDWGTPHHTLNVTPSPCHNGNGRTAPAAYRYTSEKAVYPYGRTVQQYEYGGSVYQIIHEGKFGSTFGGFGYPMPSSQESALEYRALSKLYDQIKSSEVSLNTSIGEGRETLTMMRDIAISARKARKSLKKLGRDFTLDPLQTVGGLYLGWSVGLSPLLNDLANLRKHMANEDNDTVRCRPITARASSFQTLGDKNWDTVLSERLQYGLGWRLSNLHLFENWRLGLTARPTLVWELTTLSFVVDYVVSIGAYLELLEASMLNNGVEFVNGYRTFTTRKTEDVHIHQRPSRDPSLGWTPSYVSVDINAVLQVTEKERRIMYSFPKPPLPVVKIPRAAGPLLNVAALLSQILTRRAS